MSETEHEHDDETPETPVSPETVVDEAEAEEEAEAAETPVDEPAEASTVKSEKDVDKALKALERAGTTYRNAVGRIMEEDAQALVPCPRCNAPTLGLIFDPAVAGVDDETRDAVLASIGQGVIQGPELQDAKGVETCPTCLGHGQLKYPTLNPHVQAQQCPKCAGQGYVNKDEPQQNVYPIPQTQTSEAQSVGANVTYNMPDSWGRPFGHRHYGVPPAEVG